MEKFNRSVNLCLCLWIFWFTLSILVNGGESFSKDETTTYVGCFSKRTTSLYNTGGVSEMDLTNTSVKCQELCEIQRYGYAVLDSNKCLCSYGYMPIDRQDDQLCNYKCLLDHHRDNDDNNDDNDDVRSCGGLNVYSYYATKWILPHHLRLHSATETSLTMIWDNEQMDTIELQMKIHEYRITYQLLQTYSAQVKRTGPEFIIEAIEKRFDLNDLQSASQYNICIETICLISDGNIYQTCGLKYILGETLVDTPKPKPPQPIIKRIDDNTITIRIPFIMNENGPISRIQIIVYRMDNVISQPFDKELLGTWSEAEESGVPYYITAELISNTNHSSAAAANDDDDNDDDGISAFLLLLNSKQNVSMDFIIGDGKHYGIYYNKPINMMKSGDNDNIDKINIMLGVVSTLNGITRTAYSSIKTRHTIKVEGNSHENDLNTLMVVDDEDEVEEEREVEIFDNNNDNRSLIEFTTSLALIVFCCILGFCLLSAFIFYIYLRYRTYQLKCIRRRRSGGRNGNSSNSHEMTMQQPIIIDDGDGLAIEQQTDLPTSLQSFKEQLNTIVNALPTHYKIPRNRFRMNINHVIAMGNYGDVVTGKISSPVTSQQQQQQQQQESPPPPSTENYRECQVHVLALDELNRNDQGRFLREINNISKLQQHDHLLDFLGVSASSDWFYVLIAHHNLTLKQKLLKSRRNNQESSNDSRPEESLIIDQIHEEEERFTNLSELLILQYIYEIISAMEYLSKCRILHKKLCSHNIYLNEDGKIKVAVFGPIPFLENGQRKFQLRRWLAPEVLRANHYSLKGDIWSFGVVAWECCTLGGTPYNHINRISDEQLLVILRHGQRPLQPKYMSIELYQMLLNCWTLEPSDRTNFEELALNVRQLMTSPRHALCFDSRQQLSGEEQTEILPPPYVPAIEMES